MVKVVDCLELKEEQKVYAVANDFNIGYNQILRLGSRGDLRVFEKDKRKYISRASLLKMRRDAKLLQDMQLITDATLAEFGINKRIFKYLANYLNIATHTLVVAAGKHVYKSDFERLMEVYADLNKDLDRYTPKNNDITLRLPDETLKEWLASYHEIDGIIFKMKIDGVTFYKNTEVKAILGAKLNEVGGESYRKEDEFNAYVRRLVKQERDKGVPSGKITHTTASNSLYIAKPYALRVMRELYLMHTELVNERHLSKLIGVTAPVLGTLREAGQLTPIFRLSRSSNYYMRSDATYIKERYNLAKATRMYQSRVDFEPHITLKECVDKIEAFLRDNDKVAKSFKTVGSVLGLKNFPELTLVNKEYRCNEQKLDAFLDKLKTSNCKVTTYYTVNEILECYPDIPKDFLNSIVSNYNIQYAFKFGKERYYDEQAKERIYERFVVREKQHCEYQGLLSSGDYYTAIQVRELTGCTKAQFYKHFGKVSTFFEALNRAIVPVSDVKEYMVKQGLLA